MFGWGDKLFRCGFYVTQHHHHHHHSKCEFHELSKLGQGKWSATHSWCQNTCSSSPIARGTAAVDTSSRLFRNSPSHAAVVVATPFSTTGVICKYLSNDFYKSLHCLHWNFCENFPAISTHLSPLATLSDQLSQTTTTNSFPMLFGPFHLFAGR